MRTLGRRIALVASALALVAGLAVVNAGGADAAVVQTGRAFGLAATGLIPIAPQGNVGPISNTGDYQSPYTCAARIPISTLVDAGALCGQVFTGQNATGPGGGPGVVALAGVHTLVVTVPGLPAITVIGIGVTAGSQCALGVGAYSTVAYLNIGGTTYIGQTSNPAPNTVYNLGVGTLTLNEQTVTTDPAGGQTITVNGLHLRVPGVEDVIAASATAGVSGCSTPLA